MAEENPELQVALRELDRELEEGDITEKGYQKRRTLLLSQFLGPNKPLEINASSENPSSPISSANIAPPAILIRIRPASEHGHTGLYPR
ncbi:hypothetical protein EMGR_008513 [Emarellia grisea]